MHRVAALALAVVLAACGSTTGVSGSAASPPPGGRGDELSIGAPEVAESPGAAGVSAPAAAGAGGGSRGSTAPASPPSADDTVVGRQPVTAPIELGLLYAVNDGAASAGIDNGNSFTLQRAVQAFVESYNETGGIGGRPIEPVYAELHSASNDYESQVQAACATFTEDHDVVAVLSNLGYYSENLLGCLDDAGVPLVSGDWAAPDEHDAARYPLFVTPTTLIGEARVAAVVRHLTDAGFLGPDHRIGVVIEGCPIGQRVHEHGLVPAARQAGLTIAATYELACFQSLADFGRQASDMQNAILRFREQGVDRVAFVSQAAEANLVLLFAQAADAQRWFPGYALSSIALPAVLALNAPATQMANAVGVGWLPAVDTSDRDQTAPTSTATACLERMESHGIRPMSNADDAQVYGLCDAFTLYDALLRTTSGDASADAVMTALRTVGPTYVSASTVDGRVAVSDAGRIRAAHGRLFAFVDGRFEYTSAAFGL